MTAILETRRMSEHIGASNGRHHWEIGQTAEWRVCPSCGTSHYSGIRLCGPCCHRMKLWLGDLSELRFIELASLEMGTPIRA
jgi:hypothetical protein